MSNQELPHIQIVPPNEKKGPKPSWWHRMRWRQFSLRSLFLLVLVVMFVVSWRAKPKSGWENVRSPGLRFWSQTIPGVEEGDFNGDGKTERREAVLRHGRFLVTDEHGHRLASGYHWRGKASDTWTFYHLNGKRALQGQARDGERWGKWQTWNEAGQLVAAVNYNEPQLELLEKSGGAPFFNYHEHVRYLRSGESRMYDDQGREIARGKMRHNARNGEWTLTSPDRKEQEMGSYINGLRQGPWRIRNLQTGAEQATFFIAGHRVENHEQVIANLTDQLRSNYPTVRFTAINNAGFFGETLVPALCKRLKLVNDDKNLEEMKRIVIVLGRLGPLAIAALPQIESFSTNEDDEIRRVAQVALCSLDPSRNAASIIRSQLTSLRMQTREERLHTLTIVQTYPLAALEVVDNLLTSNDEVERLAAFSTLTLVADFKELKSGWYVQEFLNANQLLKKIAETEGHLLANEAQEHIRQREFQRRGGGGGFF